MRILITKKDQKDQNESSAPKATQLRLQVANSLFVAVQQYKLDKSRNKLKDNVEKILKSIKKSKMLIKNGPSNKLVNLPGGLGITHMHPIWNDDEQDWIFPFNHPHAKFITLNEPMNMYSFLLEKSSTQSSTAMKINGYWVVHFAHNNNTIQSIIFMVQI